MLDSANVIVHKRNKSLCNFHEMNFGNMPNDNGNLLLEKSERNKLIATYQKTEILIKGFCGSQEFIRGEEKYCLWITEETKDFAYSFPIIKQRIDACEKVRYESKREATKKLSEVSYRFGEVRHKDSDSIIIPRHSSESRD
ncbi:MAG: N-6 DNA methylase, partial [Stygiobacter sp.]